MLTSCCLPTITCAIGYNKFKYLDFFNGSARVRLKLPFESIYYQTMRARRKKDLRLKNVNNLPSEAQEINNWTIAYTLCI